MTSKNQQDEIGPCWPLHITHKIINGMIGQVAMLRETSNLHVIVFALKEIT